ncbi:hypothetical protein SERLADRAFT_461409 [Serpula lacrymans var. lacrymans S7.9]|uniref:Uncharacterized protein n=1 Tax=Serpula lacrymans var. lacrymans (strain S7.9) TaxID=578457 RepID=F8NNU7_SERL9|nr:uncharacterized protein SERLADRAFT_461409 [Serpula lacrymans var. lacrymans S7.9]EGO27619.1 hypothetical protein SERLADRAFT_461409 [Serpula lacrymans var. lacrymans S7.9]
MTIGRRRFLHCSYTDVGGELGDSGGHGSLVAVGESVSIVTSAWAEHVSEAMTASSSMPNVRISFTIVSDVEDVGLLGIDTFDVICMLGHGLTKYNVPLAIPSPFSIFIPGTRTFSEVTQSYISGGWVLVRCGIQAFHDGFSILAENRYRS